MSQPGPLRVILICPDTVLREELEGVLPESRSGTVLTSSVAGYPSGSELARTLRTFSPQVVFLSFELPETAAAVMRFLEAEADGLPVLGLHPTGGAEVMREAMRAGARDFLVPPICATAVGDALQIIRTLLREEPLAYLATDHIYSFVPAKPGVGATTVAMNASAAFAHVGKMKVLLSDLDLTCGMIRFFLKLPHDLSIVDALSRSAELDVSLWPQLVTRKDGVDILHSGSVNPHAYLDPHQVSGLIDFARSTYNALCFDMSGNMERHSIQVMQESKRVFLVCNPEPGSLFLGREKVEFLKSMGVGDRISVILNRANQVMAVPAAKAEEFLGIPVAATFSDEPDAVDRAIGGACSVVADVHAKNSKLAREYRAFAQALLDTSRAVDGGDASAPQARKGMLAAA